MPNITKQWGSKACIRPQIWMIPMSNVSLITLLTHHLSLMGITFSFAEILSNEKPFSHIYCSFTYHLISIVWAPVLCRQQSWATEFKDELVKVSDTKYSEPRGANWPKDNIEEKRTWKVLSRGRASAWMWRLSRNS